MSALTAVSLVALVGGLVLQPLAGTAAAEATTSSTQAITVQRTAIDPATGVEQTVGGSYGVSITVAQTQQLRDRQAVRVTWTGARPTQGIWPDTTSALASQEEYPVVLMQCRGSADPNALVADRIRPETCWTQSPDERVQGDAINFYPPYRVDRYATRENRQLQVGLPSPLPAACANTDSGAQHWLHFVAADGNDYAGGPRGCAGLAPDASNFASSLTPSNTTYGVTQTDGTGAANFVIQTADSNASVGCSQTVPCSLVAIPIVGISCDAAGRALPASDATPLVSLTKAQRECMRTGNFAPGQATDGQPGNEHLAVAGQLWWSESNWRNRVVFPLGFAPPANVCDLQSTGDPVLVYGSQVLQQATQQWGPKFCLDPTLFRFQHVQFSEPASRSLLANGSVDATFSASSPDQPFGKPVARAPIALSGFAIAFRLDNAQGREVTSVNLTPRLLAKLMTMSYTASISIKLEYAALADNPTDLLQDPEFRALNPDMMRYTNGYDTISAATLFSLSSDSDVIKAVTSYINADPDARAWLDGTADPWGMVVNPTYKGIALPVVGWPILDTFTSKLAATNNPCLAANPVPFLPLVAGPVSNPINVTLNMQFGISNSQINCKDAGEPQQKLGAVGRQTPGLRALFGLVSLADADRYAVPTAALLSHVDASAPQQFTDTTGRTFVTPTEQSIKAAASMLRTSLAEDTFSFVFPYAEMRSSEAGRGAYPGSLLLTMDAPTTGLAAAEATKLAKLMSFMATSGQTPGSGNGQLPGGYVPITSANGLGALQTYALKAAAAVGSQSGTVPGVSATPSPSPSASTTSVPTTGGPVTTPTSQGGDATPGPDPSTSAQPTASPSPSATAIQIQAVGTTKAVQVGLAADAVPLLLLLSVITGLGAVATTFWGRR